MPLTNIRSKKRSVVTLALIDGERSGVSARAFNDVARQARQRLRMIGNHRTTELHRQLKKHQAAASAPFRAVYQTTKPGRDRCLHRISARGWR